MNVPVKFIHISDTHITTPGHKLHNNDPREKLKVCIDEIKRVYTDIAFLIITGDVIHDNDPECFSFIKETLSELSIPWWIVLGNHDSKYALYTAIPDYPQDPNGFVQFTIETPAGPCIILDTVNEGQIVGGFCEKRLNWFSSQLEILSEPALLFLHHPPFMVGLPAVDPFSLSAESTEQFLNILKPHKEKIRHMFMGHLHRPVHGSWYGIPFSSVPSITHQLELNFYESKPVIGHMEPSCYHVVLVGENQVVVHLKVCGSGSTTGML